MSILSEGERRQILQEWNQTQREYPSERGIHELFEDQVKRRPNAIAIECGEEQVSYSELDCRANRLASFLQDNGLKPEGRVGIFMERGVDLIVGLLAILKAGGAYVPLDLEHPQNLLEFILENAGIELLLTHQKSAETLPQLSAKVICLDTEEQAIEREVSHGLKVSGQNLSYVMYTSGSTGRPKGVAVTHQAVNRLVLNTNYIELTSEDIIAQVSTISFDAATFEVWGALLNGARLVVIGKETVLSALELKAEINKRKIGSMFLTTSLFNQIAMEEGSAFEGMRNLLCGGEQGDAKSLMKVLSDSRPQRLLNVYGPTEATTFTTWELLNEEGLATGSISIGRGLANTRIYVLDKQMQPVPVGVPGEIYIGGDGLARCYQNQPGSTADKFMPDLFSQQPGARLYRTGDIVRYLPDGRIEFLGRVDNQVKVRGYRIEPGEIETVINAHSGVKASVVTIKEYSPDDKRLVAYVVSSKNEGITTGELREYLKEKLPPYMIPSAITTLDALPLTANGKIDRDALPDPIYTAFQHAQSYVAPSTPDQVLLAGMWSQLLNLAEVGIHDNFFDLGGNSLLATRLIAQTRNAFNVELPLRALFDYPTIAGVCEAIARSPENGKPHSPAIKPLPRRTAGG